MMVLARMGNKQKLGEIIQRVKSEQNIVRRRILCDDLAWTSQQKSFDVLKEYLYSTVVLTEC